MFSELHDFNRNLNLNARSVAWKQRQVFQKFKKVSFLFINWSSWVSAFNIKQQKCSRNWIKKSLKMRFIIQLSFRKCCFSSIFNVSKTHEIREVHVLTSELLPRSNGKCLRKIRESLSSSFFFFEIIFIMQMSFLQLCFQVFQCSFYFMFLAEVYVLT